jgi:hypothetical protein
VAWYAVQCANVPQPLAVRWSSRTPEAPIVGRLLGWPVPAAGPLLLLGHPWQCQDATTPLRAARRLAETFGLGHVRRIEALNTLRAPRHAPGGNVATG